MQGSCGLCAREACLAERCTLVWRDKERVRAWREREQTAGSRCFAGASAMGRGRADLALQPSIDDRRPTTGSPASSTTRGLPPQICRPVEQAATLPHPLPPQLWGGADLLP